MKTAEPKTQYKSFRQLMDEDGYFVYTNVGTSMLPLLRAGRDIIEIRRPENGRRRKYDVVLYLRGDMYILHRIVRVLPDGYIIAGDHNTFLERDINDEQILGVMTRVIRDGRSVTPDNFLYKCYVHLWCAPYPVRIFILRCWGKLRRIAGRIRKSISGSAGKRTT